MITIFQRADITLKGDRRRHYEGWCQKRCKQSILNLETPEKREQAMNQKLFFHFMKKIGSVGRWETKHFMGMAERFDLHEINLLSKLIFIWKEHQKHKLFWNMYRGNITKTEVGHALYMYMYSTWSKSACSRKLRDCHDCYGKWNMVNGIIELILALFDIVSGNIRDIWAWVSR